MDENHGFLRGVAERLLCRPGQKRECCPIAQLSFAATGFWHLGHGSRPRGIPVAPFFCRMPCANGMPAAPASQVLKNGMAGAGLLLSVLSVRRRGGAFIGGGGGGWLTVEMIAPPCAAALDRNIER